MSLAGRMIEIAPASLAGAAVPAPLRQHPALSLTRDAAGALTVGVAVGRDAAGYPVLFPVAGAPADTRRTQRELAPAAPIVNLAAGAITLALPRELVQVNVPVTIAEGAVKVNVAAAAAQPAGDLEVVGPTGITIVKVRRD